MPPLSILVPLFLLAVSASSRVVSAESLFNSPADYFGGDDHVVYLDWATARSETYPKSIFVPSASADSDSGVAVHWSIDGDTISLAVAARATGWLGFGISENGGMTGADVVIFETANPDRLKDSFVLEKREPVEDETQDWTLVSHLAESGFLIFEATRLLDTNDPQDRIIMNDASTAMPATRIIAAWGESNTVEYHGANNARGAVRWYGSRDDEIAFQETMRQQSEGSFVLSALNFTIPAIDTEYASFCFSRNDILAQGVPDVELNVIGYEPVVDEQARRFVHHFTLTGLASTGNGLSETCDGDFEDAFELAYAWAPGEGAFALPENLGAPFGGATGFNSFVLETHYNNPELVDGVVDSSGVRFYYTTAKREFEMGILSLGDPDVNLYGQAIGNGLTQHSFGCPSSCSTSTIQEPITVLREYLHMHRTGTRMVNQQIRDGEVVHSGAIDFFAFDQQGNQAVQQDPFEVLPGDGFNTVCYYRSEENNVFGLSSQEEMCIAFVYYYPRQTYFDVIPWSCSFDLGLDECEAVYTERVLGSDADLQRTFGSSSGGDDGGDGGVGGGDDGGAGGGDGGTDDSSSNIVLNASTVLLGLFSLAVSTSTLLL